VRSVRRSADWDRIKALPAAEPVNVQVEGARIQASWGTPVPLPLRDVQTLALVALEREGGGFFPIQVGGGKTLVTLLAPKILNAWRPVLLLPASLKEKTQRDQDKYSKHWQVSKNIRLISYEELGRVRMAEELERYRPDLIIADECHRLKNSRAACTRRVARYMKEHPEVPFVGLSGTIMRHSIKDFAHLLIWAFGDRAPVPLNRDELEEWAQALDLNSDPMARMNPGPLGVDKDDARRGFRDRLRSHPGIVIYESEDTNASLRVQALEYGVNQKTEQAFVELRKSWATPTGYTFSEAIMLWKFARELALGHWVEWDPHAPEDWLTARRNWAHKVREVLAHSRTYDTELQVRLAVKNGDINGDELQAWEETKNSFTPNPRDLWQDDNALTACASWAGSGPGIIFTGHSFFGRALAAKIGAPYYGAEGKNERGDDIESELGDRVIVASIQANGTGRNLQQFSRALVTASLNDLEQLLGRLHRQGQEADEVEFTFLVGCWEHVDGFWKACESAQSLTDLTGGRFKLTYADIVFPTREELKERSAARWKQA
jgi:hypothetical protein